MFNKKIILTILSLIFSFISGSILFLVILKYKIFTSTYGLQAYQIIVFCLAFIFFLISFFSIFLDANKQINILTILFSTTFSFIIIELFLLFSEHKIKNKYFGDYTKNTKYEEFLEKKLNGFNPVFAIPPSNFIKKNKYFKELFPLSGISNSHTIYCNENGYWSNYESDRYGFNNDDENWNKEIDLILLGDSTMHGACVNKKDTIAGNLKKINNELNILNLGYGGSGTLIEFATLKEFFIPNTKQIIFLYSEENDLKNLRRENKNKILKKYYQEDFKQDLMSKQNFINSKLIKFQDDQINIHKKNQKNTLIKIVTLTKFRKLLSSKTSEIRKIYPDDLNNFKQVMSLIKNFSSKNNSKLYFVYSPDFNRYTEKFKYTENLFNYDQVLEIVKNLDIQIIDLHELLFSKLDDPLSLFPMRSYGHYNEEGYKKTAEIIYKEIEKIKNSD